MTEHPIGTTIMIRNRLVIAACLIAPVATLSACNEKGLAYGDPNSVIAVMDTTHWQAVSDEVYDAFEHTITTVRDEKTFTVTYQEPYDEHWINLRRFRQMLVVGSESDPWVAEAIDKTRTPAEGQGIHQIYDVWGTGQTVTLVVMPEGWTAEQLRPLLTEVAAMLDDQYRSYARNRMYMSGRDTALADTLSIEAGFSLDLPMVYRWHRDGDVFVFRNDNPDPSELIREFVVTWASPAPAETTAESLLEWRARMVEQHYSEPQEYVREGMTERSFDFQGHEALELRSQWRNPPDRGWPAGGPVITRAITCDGQDRTYFIDAWLYAPGKEKYEYMIQLETILASFRCGG